MSKRIYILNFEEYNPRKDVKKHSWFRVDNNIPFSQKLYGLNASQKWVWICLLSFCSQAQRDWTECNFHYIHFVSGVPLNEIEACIAQFEVNGMIKIESLNAEKTNYVTPTNVDVTPTIRARSNPCPTDVQTLQTDITDITFTARQKFEVAEGFSEDPILCEVLPFISTTVQESWLKRYEKGWITQVLVDAVLWHLNETNKKPHQIDDWGKRLVGWVKRQKKPILGGSTRNPVDELCDELLEEQNRA